MVLLDVAASGHKDLKAEDFMILEDGKPQALAFFKLQQPGTANGKLRQPELGPYYFTNAGSAPAMGTRNVIVIDPEESSAGTGARVRSELLKYLKQATISDPVAIFQYTPNGMEMLQDFTTDRNLLERGMDGRAPGPKRRMVDAASLPSSAFITMQNRWQSQDEILEEFIATLAAYPGRKNLIWLAEPPALGYDLLAEKPGFKNPFRVPYSFPMIESLAAAVLPARPVVPGTLKLAAAHAGPAGSTPTLMDSDFMLYLVEPEPFIPPPPCRVSHDASPSHTMWSTDESGFDACQDDQGSPDEMTPEFHRAMNNLAKRAGGKAYHSRYLDHVIRESMNAGSTYYVLGYYPENTNPDGGVRHVEVRLLRRNAKLHYRPTYVAAERGNYSATAVDVKREDLERALDLGTPLANSISFYAQVTPPSSPAEEKVAVQYAVNAESLEFQQTSDGLRHASVECAVQAYTDAGYPLEATSNIYEASLQPNAFKQVSDAGFPCIETVNLPSGDYVLRLAVRDNRTGSIGTVNAQVSVPLRLAPPPPDPAERTF
jgi:VWFA-related protein